MKFEIATIRDAPQIREVYNEHILKGGSTMDQTLKSLNDIEDWFNSFTSRELIVLLKIDNSLVGWGIIKRYSDRSGYDKACETAIYLKPSELRKGYGTAIKKWIIKKCKELDYHHLVAKIFSSNTASIEYNKRLGYELVGVQREIGHINGQWQDVTIMQLILE